MSERNLKPVILEILHSHHLLSTKEVLDQLEVQGKKYNKTSAYRALEQLVNLNQICRHYIHNGEALYELREDHHAHLVCNTCGRVDIVACEYEQPSSIAGFRVEHHHLTLMGVCKKCQESIVREQT